MEQGTTLQYMMLVTMLVSKLVMKEMLSHKAMDFQHATETSKTRLKENLHLVKMSQEQTCNAIKAS